MRPTGLFMVSAAALGLALAAVGDAPAPPGVAELQTMTARFAPVDVRVDLSALPANERAALACADPRRAHHRCALSCARSRRTMTRSCSG